MTEYTARLIRDEFAAGRSIPSLREEFSAADIAEALDVMPDALTLAVYAAQQAPDATTSFEADYHVGGSDTYMVQLHNVIVAIFGVSTMMPGTEIQAPLCATPECGVNAGSYAHSPFCPNSTAYRPDPSTDMPIPADYDDPHGDEEPTMSRTATILAEMRAADAAHAARNAERLAEGTMPGLPKERPALATGKGRREALFMANAQLTADGPYRQAERDRGNDTWKTEQAVKRVNNRFRSKAGRLTPDMVTSLLAFFAENTASIVEQALVTALPTKVADKQAKAMLAEIDYMEGFPGANGRVSLPSTPAEVRALVKSINPGSGRAGGRPRKVRLTDRWDAGLAPIHTCHDLSGIPTSEAGTAAGAGRDQGAGWERYIMSDDAGVWVRTLPGMTPAQRVRMDAALAAVTFVAGPIE